MARPYSLDVRERAVARVGAGESVRSVAAVLQVSVASVVKWSQRFRATGSAAAGPMHGHRPRLLLPAPRLASFAHGGWPRLHVARPSTFLRVLYSSH
ncbi:MAG: helix-turn-helix domain-containing protein [Methylocella sp.]